MQPLGPVAGRAAGDVDAELRSAGVAIDDQVQVREQHRARRGELRRRASRPRASCAQRRRFAGSASTAPKYDGCSESACPHVELERQPRQAVDGHGPVVAERDLRLAVPGGVRVRRGRHARDRQGSNERRIGECGSRVDPDAAVGCRTTAAEATTANTPTGASLLRIMLPFVGDKVGASV